MAYIYSITRNRDATEEIFQELGLVIADHAQRGTEVERFIGWAVGIARRQIAAYYRANQRQRKIFPLTDRLAEVMATSVMENEQHLESEKDQLQMLEECVSELTGRNRDVIIQKYQKGKSNSSIAESLHWEINSVKVALSRARKVLLACVQHKLRASDGGPT